MGVFLSMGQAKDHLRVPLELHDNDADIALKLDQAEAIVLGFLKNRVIAIASIAIGNPAVVTTDGPHSLVTGATYTLAGTSTTPTLNGAQIVTVTGPTTFTVPVNVTVGQSAEAGTISNVVYTSATVPKPVQTWTSLWLTHLYEHRGDDMTPAANLWAAMERELSLYRDPTLA